MPAPSCDVIGCCLPAQFRHVLSDLEEDVLCHHHWNALRQYAPLRALFYTADAPQRLATLAPAPLDTKVSVLFLDALLHETEKEIVS